MAERKEAKDPTVRSDSARVARGTEGVHPAKAISDADNAAGDQKFKDNPDKPDETTIAQVEVLPDEQASKR